jgi:hypothetical protein
LAGGLRSSNHPDAPEHPKHSISVLLQWAQARVVMLGRHRAASWYEALAIN